MIGYLAYNSINRHNRCNCICKMVVMKVVVGKNYDLAYFSKCL